MARLLNCSARLSFDKAHLFYLSNGFKNDGLASFIKSNKLWLHYDMLVEMAADAFPFFPGTNRDNFYVHYDHEAADYICWSAINLRKDVQESLRAMGMFLNTENGMLTKGMIRLIIKQYYLRSALSSRELALVIHEEYAALAERYLESRGFDKRVRPCNRFKRRNRSCTITSCYCRNRCCTITNCYCSYRYEY